MTSEPARQGLIRGFLSGLRFPQLFLVLAGLFLVDLVTPDPIVLVDEAMLGVLAVMLGMWRRRGSAESNDITTNIDGESQ